MHNCGSHANRWLQPVKDQYERMDVRLMAGQSVETGIPVEQQADHRGSSSCCRAANYFPINLPGGRWEMWGFSASWSHEWPLGLTAKRLLRVPLSCDVCCWDHLVAEVTFQSAVASFMLSRAPAQVQAAERNLHNLICKKSDPPAPICWPDCDRMPAKHWVALHHKI